MLVLRRTQVCYNAANGLELRAGGSATLHECEFFANGRQGILIWNGAGLLEATNCEIHSHKNESGVMVRENGPFPAAFHGCKIHTNGMAGVVVEDRGFAKLRKCMIYNNHHGVLVQGAASADVRKCNVSRNGSHGVFVGFDHKSGYVTVIKNRLEDNHCKGLFVGTGLNDRLKIEENEESGNRNLPPIMPSHFFIHAGQSGGIVNEHLRKWAKRVAKRPPRQGGPTPEEDAMASVVRALVPQAAAAVLSCAFCEKPAPDGVRFAKCAQCKALCYCSKDCQRRHWQSGHKAVCTPARAKHPAFVNPQMNV